MHCRNYNAPHYWTPVQDTTLPLLDTEARLPPSFYLNLYISSIRYGPTGLQAGLHCWIPAAAWWHKVLNCRSLTVLYSWPAGPYLSCIPCCFYTYHQNGIDCLHTWSLWAILLYYELYYCIRSYTTVLGHLKVGLYNYISNPPTFRLTQY